MRGFTGRGFRLTLVLSTKERRVDDYLQEHQISTGNYQIYSTEIETIYCAYCSPQIIPRKKKKEKKQKHYLKFGAQ